MAVFPAFSVKQGFSLILAVCLGVVAGILNEFPAMQGLQHDIIVSIAKKPEKKDIVIVAIDEHSLEKLGRWPWSRSIHAQLIDKLKQAGVKAIGMDIFFMEPEQTNPEADQKLAQAMVRQGKVVLPIILNESDPNGLQVVMPLPQLTEASANLGFVNIQPGRDGILRNVYLQAEIAGMRFYSLPKALLEAVDPKSLSSFYQQPLHNPQTLAMTDDRIIMSFPDAKQYYTQLSYWDVLNNEAMQRSLEGKIVLVGMTAAGLAPRFAVPSLMNSVFMSGVEFNANALLALKSGMALRPLATGWRFLLTFVLVFIPVLLFCFVSHRRCLTYLVFAALCTLIVSFVLYRFFAIWYGPFTALLVQTLSYPLRGWHRQRLETKGLLQDKEQADFTLHAIGNAVITTNADGIIEFMNPVAEIITGYDLQEAQGQLIDNIVTLKKDAHGEIFPAIRKFLAADKSVITTKPLSLLNQQSQKYAIRITANAIRAPSGTIKAIVFALNDISEIIAVSRKIKHLATHDALTQLPNRTLLEDRLLKAINMGERNFTQFAVLFIDLDGFKKINDNQGHAIGDQLLKEVATRLSSKKRKSDTVSRWGGDEFVILLENIANENVVIDIAKGIIDLLSVPFELDGYKLRVSPSIGVSVYPKDGDRVEDLLEKADAAMYQVKRMGRNNFCFYTEKIHEVLL